MIPEILQMLVDTTLAIGAGRTIDTTVDSLNLGRSKMLALVRVALQFVLAFVVVMLMSQYLTGLRVGPLRLTDPKTGLFFVSIFLATQRSLLNEVMSL